MDVASSREDAWIETRQNIAKNADTWSRPPARTRGLKRDRLTGAIERDVASSREDAWIETCYNLYSKRLFWSRPPARTRGLKQ